MPLFWGAILKLLLKGVAKGMSAASSAGGMVQKASQATSLGNVAGTIGDKLGGAAGKALGEKAGAAVETAQSLGGGVGETASRTAENDPAAANPATVPFQVDPGLAASDQSRGVDPSTFEPRLNLERPDPSSVGLSMPTGLGLATGEQEEQDLGGPSLEELRRRRLEMLRRGA